MTQQLIVKFQSIKIEGWRQFDNIDIELHPRLTVITGSNGAGKSSLLRLFSRHFGFDRPYLSTPQVSERGAYTYKAGIFDSFFKKFSRKKINTFDIGTLTYSNGIELPLVIQDNPSVQYNILVNRNQQQHVPGIHIDSHQPVSMYQQVGQIPTSILTPSVAYTNYHSEMSQRYNGGNSGSSPMYRMKESIISMAMFGEGNSQVRGNAEILHAYQSFIELLKKILPESLGFLDISIRTPDVVIVTKSGEFLIDAASGGLMTLFDLSWRLHLFSLTNPEFVVTMDEPENHLHPTMQRSLLRRLMDAFPKAQFIIATHSPFMVSSVRDSSVYVLRYLRRDSHGKIDDQVMPSETSRVVSEKLDTVNKAGSASEILREVLGVSATIPEWVEEGLGSVIASYRGRPITSEVLQELRRELVQLGYEALYPDALAALTGL